MSNHRETAVGVIAGCALVILGAHALQFLHISPRPVPSPPALNLDTLLHAHALAESSNGNPPPYWDRSQSSWGRYAFGRARWKESGGNPSEWGRASVGEQDRIMRRALSRYLRNLPVDSTVEDAIIWTANWHNLGHGSPRRTAHAEKVLGFYRKEIK